MYNSRYFNKTICIITAAIITMVAVSCNKVENTVIIQDKDKIAIKDTAAGDLTAGNTEVAEEDKAVVEAETEIPHVEEEKEENSEMTQEELYEKYSGQFTKEPVGDEIFARISGKSYPEGCTLDLNELRYLRIPYMNFDGETVIGEMIVNTAIADITLDIFKELYKIGYPIEKMVLIDEYDADDEHSMEDNNSSAFNYRFIAETTVLSNHALGYAIDINTLYNPYVYTRKDGTLFLQPVNAQDYTDRGNGCPYYINHGDACWQIFINHGFEWGGDWNTKKDYQHFEYPHN